MRARRHPAGADYTQKFSIASLFSTFFHNFFTFFFARKFGELTPCPATQLRQ